MGLALFTVLRAYERVLTRLAAAHIRWHLAIDC